MAWLEVSVILVIFLGPSCAFQVAENVVFEQTREISVVRSKLIFSFRVDLKSYRKQREKIQGNLVLTEMNLGQVIIERRKQNTYLCNSGPRAQVYYTRDSSTVGVEFKI